MNKQAKARLLIRPHPARKSFANPAGKPPSTPLTATRSPSSERVVTLVPLALPVRAIHNMTHKGQTSVGERDAKR